MAADTQLVCRAAFSGGRSCAPWNRHYFAHFCLWVSAPCVWQWPRAVLGEGNEPSTEQGFTLKRILTTLENNRTVVSCCLSEWGMEWCRLWGAFSWSPFALQMMNKVFGGTVHKKSVREDRVFSITLDNTCSLFRCTDISSSRGSISLGKGVWRRGRLLKKRVKLADNFW